MDGKSVGGGQPVMPLTVVSSSLCDYNDLSIKALSERVWPLHYKGKKNLTFSSHLSYAIHSLMTSLANYHMALWVLFTHVSISYLMKQQSLPRVDGLLSFFNWAGFSLGLWLMALQYTRNIFFFTD